MSTDPRADRVIQMKALEKAGKWSWACSVTLPFDKEQIYKVDNDAPWQQNKALLLSSGRSLNPIAGCNPTVGQINWQIIATISGMEVLTVRGWLTDTLRKIQTII